MLSKYIRKFSLKKWRDIKKIDCSRRDNIFLSRSILLLEKFYPHLKKEKKSINKENWLSCF